MTADQQTRAVLLAQRDRCPSLRPEDLLKALHQSVFGCGHFVSDEAAGLALIQEELAGLPPQGDAPAIEPLDGGFCRLWLGYLPQSGLSPETLFRLFSLSSRLPAGGAAALEPKLDCLLELARQGAFPFSYEETRQAVERWRQAGFPACHHSEAYRQAVAPAYRVIRRDYIRLLPLLAGIDRLRAERERVIVALEGGSAGGKTTLAALLAKLFDCNVFHMDDFFLRPQQRTPERYAEPGGNVDRERFEQEVLLPLKRGDPVRYRPYDCGSGTIGPGRTVEPKPLSIVEGAYSMHPALADAYDLSVFLEVSPEVQRRRILERNGPEAGRQFFSRWIPLEQRYFEAMEVRARCGLILEVEP